MVVDELSFKLSTGDGGMELSVGATLIEGSAADGSPAIDAPTTAATTDVSALANQPTSGSTKLGDGIHPTAGRMERKMSSPKSK